MYKKRRERNRERERGERKEQRIYVSHFSIDNSSIFLLFLVFAPRKRNSDLTGYYKALNYTFFAVKLSPLTIIRDLPQ